MSDEAKLNPELKKLEATLGRLAIPPASINRDKLMYQTGWAGALASFANEAGVSGSVSRSDSNPTWLWKVTAILTSAAAILLGAILIFQSGNAPTSLNNRQVTDGANSRAKQNNANLSVEIDRSEAENSPARTDDEFGESDIVKLVLDFPTGKILKSGLSFQQPNLAAEQVEPVAHRPGQPSQNALPVSQRQLMEEFLPTRRRKTPTWPSLFFRTGTSS